MSMRETYEAKLQAQLDEWAADINILKAKADKAKVDVQQEYNKQIEHLQLMHVSATAKLAEFKEASEEAWHDLKAGVESAWELLENALKSAASRFNNTKED
ncbi:MAG: coiled coil domain-containing protein [Campylobacterota bacterium]